MLIWRHDALVAKGIKPEMARLTLAEIHFISLSESLDTSAPALGPCSLLRDFIFQSSQAPTPREQISQDWQQK